MSTYDFEQKQINQLQAEVEHLRAENDRLKKRIAELESFISDYANQECNCGYPKVCSTCRDIAYAKEILKGGAE